MVRKLNLRFYRWVVRVERWLYHHICQQCGKIIIRHDPEIPAFCSDKCWKDWIPF